MPTCWRGRCLFNLEGVNSDVVKRRPHHDLQAVQTKFARMETLEITRTAVNSARALGFGLADVVDIVQALEPGDFIKSETAHNPPNSRVWHDTYNLPWGGRQRISSSLAKR